MAVKSASLSGVEVKISGLSGVYASVFNSGTSLIYASAKPGIAAGADGVMPIPAGGSVLIPDCNGEVYLLGTGTATAVGTTEAINFFKPAAGGDDSGGSESGVNQQYVDAQDTATLTAAKTYTDEQVSPVASKLSLRPTLLQNLLNVRDIFALAFVVLI